MKEDVTSVSPTLGFIIKTIDFAGYVYCRLLVEFVLMEVGTSSIFVSCAASPAYHGTNGTRGCWRAKNSSVLLEKLL